MSRRPSPIWSARRPAAATAMSWPPGTTTSTRATTSPTTRTTSTPGRSHCVAGTEGSGFHPNFAPAVASGAIDAVFDKGAYTAAYSGFEGTDENGTLARATGCASASVTEVDVVGIATDHCVRATALDALRAGLRTHVLLDLTAGVARAHHRAGAGGAAGGGRRADRQAGGRGRLTPPAAARRRQRPPGSPPCRPSGAGGPYDGHPGQRGHRDHRGNRRRRGLRGWRAGRGRRGERGSHGPRDRGRRGRRGPEQGPYGVPGLGVVVRRRAPDQAVRVVQDGRDLVRRRRLAVAAQVDGPQTEVAQPGQGALVGSRRGPGPGPGSRRRTAPRAVPGPVWAARGRPPRFRQEA